MVGHTAAGDTLVAPWRCGAWVCERGCGYQRSMRWYARAMTGVEALGGVRTKFLTLTFDRAGYADPEAACRAIGPCWDRWRTSSQRAWGRYDFLRVIELHKSGWPHLHALIGVDAYMPHEQVRTLAVRAGFGRVVDIRQAWRAKAARGEVRGLVEVEGSTSETRTAVARYLSKYLVKQRLWLPSYVRRVSCSRTWGGERWHERSNPETDTTWELVTSSPEILVRAMEQAGVRVKTTIRPAPEGD